MAPYAWASGYPDPNRVTMWNSITDGLHTLGQNPQKARITKMKLRHDRAVRRIKNIHKADS